jgi:chloramphenicol 3-O phosphotransferase
MEPRPAGRGPGRIIFLNGASSSGKSTLAKAIQHIIEFRAWRENLARLLADVDVFLIGVHCDLAEIDRRERDRADRRPGEGRAHVETDLIHTFGPYDLDVDTTHGVSSALTESVLAAWRIRHRPRALLPRASDA